MSLKDENTTKPRKTTRKGSLNSWRTYLHKVHKQVHPDLQISAKALGQLDEFIKILALFLAKCGRVVCINARKSTVGKSEIALAVQLHFPGNLAKHALSELENAICKFQAVKTLEKQGKKMSMNNNQDRSAPVRREHCAGILFSVALAEKFIRDFGASNLSVSKNASVALAAAIESIATKILIYSGIVVRESKKIIITIRHVYIAIVGDEDLFRLMNVLNIEFLGTGVLPNIRSELLPTKKKRQKQAANRKKNSKGKKGNPKKPHKYLPGTKALMEIRRYQKTDGLLLRKLPFDRIIRSIAEKLNSHTTLGLNTIHFGGNSIVVLQHFIEQRVVALCVSAQDLAIHANRDGVNDADIQLAWKLIEFSIPFIETGISEVGDNGIERLAYRAGIKRKGSSMYNMVRCYMYSLINTILFQALHFVKYRNVITIGIQDLQAAFQSLRINFTIPLTMGKSKTNCK